MPSIVPRASYCATALRFIIFNSKFDVVVNLNCYRASKLKPVLLLPTLFLILQIVTIPLLTQTHQFQPITNAQCG